MIFVLKLIIAIAIIIGFFAVSFWLPNWLIKEKKSEVKK